MQPSAYSLREYIAHYVSKGWMRAAPELCVMGGWIHRFEGGVLKSWMRGKDGKIVFGKAIHRFAGVLRELICIRYAETQEVV